MPEAYDALLEGRQTVFDTLTGLTRATDVFASLLQASETVDDFDVLLDITSSWFFKPATTRSNALLEVARDDAEMTDAMAAATHIRVGDDIFVIVQGDTIQPSGFAVTWKIFVERFTKKSQIGSLY